jgi:multiple sugar transport system substrate-binding protein
MPVVSGFAIPKSAPDPAQAKALIKYMLTSGAQAKTLDATGFFPVVKGNAAQSLGAGLSSEAKAVAAQSTATDGVESLLPVGLGDKSDAFDKVFTDAFARIVVHNQDAATAVASEASKLQSILNATGAACWKPDPASKGPCQVGG